MRVTCTFLLMALLSASSAAGEVVHVHGPRSWAQAPVVPEEMNQRVEEAAAQYESNAPVPRIALSDVAFPSSAEEFEKTGGYGVLLLTALSQESIELPLKRVYIALHGKEFVLDRIPVAMASPEQSPTVARVLGPHRWDALYLFPVRLMEDGAVLTIDFSANRTGFALNRYSAQDAAALGYEVGVPDESPDKAAAQEAIMSLVAREYPGFLGGAP